MKQTLLLLMFAVGSCAVAAFPPPRSYVQLQIDRERGAISLPFNENPTVWVKLYGKAYHNPDADTPGRDYGFWFGTRTGILDILEIVDKAEDKVIKELTRKPLS